MLSLKENENFNAFEIGKSFSSAYMRIGEVKYNWYKKFIQLEFKFYNSKEDYESNKQTIIRRFHTATQEDFNKWFDFRNVNIQNNLLTQIENYLTHLKSGGFFNSGYTRVGDFTYDRDSSIVTIEIETYLSEQSFLDKENLISSEIYTVDKNDFNTWFNFNFVNSGDSIVRRVFGYLIQLPGIYPGTLVFSEWQPDFT